MKNTPSNTWQTNNLEEFENVANEVFGILKQFNESTVVVGLVGDLGAGKTTISKIIAKLLGVQNDVVSPTFNIVKIYDTTDEIFKKFIHIDAYRFDTDNNEEIESLKNNLKLHSSIGGYFNMPNSLVFIEWPQNIKSILPEKIKYLEISHNAESPEKRRISLY